jgi:hypothetical protein
MRRTIDTSQPYADLLTKEDLRAPALTQELRDARQKEFNTLSKADRKIAMRGDNKFVLRIKETINGKPVVRLVPIWRATFEDFVLSIEDVNDQLDKYADKLFGRKPGTSAKLHRHREIQRRRKKMTIVGPDYSDEDD